MRASWGSMRLVVHILATLLTTRACTSFRFFTAGLSLIASAKFSLPLPM